MYTHPDETLREDQTVKYTERTVTMGNKTNENEILFTTLDYLIQEGETKRKTTTLTLSNITYCEGHTTYSPGTGNLQSRNSQ